MKSGSPERGVDDEGDDEQVAHHTELDRRLGNTFDNVRHHRADVEDVVGG